MTAKTARAAARTTPCDPCDPWLIWCLCRGSAAAAATPRYSVLKTALALLPYLVHPGTAFNVGYTGGYDNLRRDWVHGALVLGGAPTLSTGRQVFVKSSYLFRF